MSQPPVKRRARHALRSGDRRSPVLTTVTSAVLAAALAGGVGAGAASAVEQGGTTPEQGAPEQGGTTPEPNAPEQGGTTPAPPPPPPANVPGRGSIPAPPQEAPYQPYTPEVTPQYDDAYNPVPNGPISPPKRAAPVRPIAPPPNKIRVGNFITPIPRGMSDRDVNSINAWSAYGEAKIAQNLIAVGVPEDKATRQAAATIIGVMAGGTAGAVVLGLPAAALGAGAGVVLSVPLSVLSVPFFPPAALALPIVGGLGGAALGMTGGVVAGAALGGALAYSLGAGDPGARPREPWKEGKPQAPKVESLPSPEANQFQMRLPAQKAAQSGVPAVDYVVNRRGDVHGKIGTQEFGWSAEQAQAPYRLLGPGVEKAARQLTKQGVAHLKSVLPGVQIDWPQEQEATAAMDRSMQTRERFS